jgi:molecular chaperone GrpE
MKKDDHKLSKKEAELEQKLTELTGDLQRVQADFVNYRRRVEDERKALTDMAKAATIMKLLPMVDDIERAITHVPADLADNKWVQGIISLGKRLEKSLADLGLQRIDAAPGTPFDPNLHEAVSMEDSKGDEEVISEELRAGYRLGSQVVRHSLVKVKRQPTPPERKPEHVVKEQLPQEEPEHIRPED